MNKGKSFEQDIQGSAKGQGIWILRLNDTSLSWMHEKEARFTPTNICDFLVYKNPNLFAIECKSTTYKRISIQRNPAEKDAMIKAHQIKSLSEASLQDGLIAGFLLNYRNDKEISDNIVYWLPIQNFNDFLVKESLKSISRDDCEKYGGIIIPQKLKRTRYSYDMVKTLELMVNNYKEHKDDIKIKQENREELLSSIFGEDSEEDDECDSDQ